MKLAGTLKREVRMELRKAQNGFAIRLPTESWYGGRRFNHLYNLRDFSFPRSWNIEVFEPDGVEGMRPLGDDEIRKGVQQAIGTEPLRKLAEGRKDAVIIVDDLSRPTPAFAVVSFILDELRAGGIGEDKTTIIIGLGTHRPITKAEQRRKLGKEIVDRVKVVNHNAFTRKIKTYRRPDGGPDLKINRVVGDADLKISVSGIIPHGGAGFGGGGKAILPSVASYDSIHFNHSKYDWEGYGTIYPEEIQSPCIRRDIELCARAAGLDYSVNLVFTPFKEVLGVFSGDFIRAHREGCVFARRLYLTGVPDEQLDIVIADSYPMDTDIGQSHRGTWPEKYGKRSVLVAGARDGWAYHGDNGKSYRVYRQMRKHQEPLDIYRFKGTAEGEAENGLYYSPTLSPGAFYERDAKRRFFNLWDEVIAGLDSEGRDVTVGIFPYSSMQLEKK